MCDLEISQKQHSDGVVLTKSPVRGPNEEDGEKSKAYEFNTTLLHGKAQVCILDLQSKHAWGWY